MARYYLEIKPSAAKEVDALGDALFVRVDASTSPKRGLRAVRKIAAEHPSAQTFRAAQKHMQ